MTTDPASLCHEDVPDDVEVRSLRLGHSPRVVHAALDDLTLADWCELHRDWIDHAFAHHGALLFRGFECRGSVGFADALRCLGCAPMTFAEESSPRTRVDGNIFTSTEYPPSEEIFPHNEGSYFARCPSRVFFMCERPSLSGGETTLVDGARLLDAMRRDVRDAFATRGWTYVRRYGLGLGLTWQAAFGTEDRGKVEAYCADNAVEWEWRGDELVTRQTRAAIVTDPFDDRDVFCNHICFFHRSSIPAALMDLLRAGDPQDLPFESRFGDGDEIPDEYIEHLRGLYRALALPIPWRRRDLVMVNNVRFAHGRRPFEGSRRLLFAMATDPRP